MIGTFMSQRIRFKLASLNRSALGQGVTTGMNYGESPEELEIKTQITMYLRTLIIEIAKVQKAPRFSMWADCLNLINDTTNLS